MVELRRYMFVFLVGCFLAVASAVGAQNDGPMPIQKETQQRLKQAEIQLERTKLSFLANATHITIMEAKKYYDSRGRRMLDIVLRNASNLTQAESALSLTAK